VQAVYGKLGIVELRGLVRLASHAALMAPPALDAESSSSESARDSEDDSDGYYDSVVMGMY
jgi:hypothetical protein